MDAKAQRGGEAIILGIESSCDETAAAVVRSGRDMLSNVVFSQITTHVAYGGVVPELASREHLRAIAPIVRQAVGDAGLSYESLDAIAVTQGPGLAGALLVGITFAKALAFAFEKPLIAVNHIAGHIHAVLMEMERGGERMEFPQLALVVSGGHTHLYLVEHSIQRAKGLAYSYRNLGRTLDDAAGEAFDKVAKLLGLPYPGGPVIDALAPHGNPHAVKFALSRIKEKIYRKQQGDGAPRVDFSFSGIKTAVLRYVELNGMQPGIEARREIAQAPIEAWKNSCDRQALDLIASFQSAVVNDLITKTLRAAEITSPHGIIVSGGVAANSELRRSFIERAAKHGLPVHFPARGLSTDNAAMIAAAAYPKYLQEEFAETHFNAEPNLALG
ncbi:MAG: tRNA (adenosine(37)-N6)-threonylcarbamoyltransferase complex transferase subunit TsaD [Acidobacteriaceae bacterium]